MLTHIISPLDATGQYLNENKFAFDNADKPCSLVGSSFWVETEYEYGCRQRVRLEDGTEGIVWLEELVEICKGIYCDGCFQCES